MSDILYALANTVAIWRPIAIVLLAGVVWVCVSAVMAEWGK